LLSYHVIREFQVQNVNYPVVTHGHAI
jgi:hypothetical protein